MGAIPARAPFILLEPVKGTKAPIFTTASLLEALNLKDAGTHPVRKNTATSKVNTFAIEKKNFFRIWIFEWMPKRSR